MKPRACFTLLILGLVAPVSIPNLLADPSPEESAAATLDKLPATGRTIGGPGGIRDLAPTEEPVYLLGSPYAQRVDLCATILNLGGGDVELTVHYGGGSSYADVKSGMTRTLCGDRVDSVFVQCRNHPCTFQWRIDAAKVVE